MDLLREYLPFLIPLLVIQLALMFFSVFHVLRHNAYRVGSRAVWLIVCLLVTVVGPVLYFTIGKGDE